MYRTRDWRRAQRDRYKKRVWNQLRFRLDYHSNPDPISKWRQWSDNKGNTRHFNSWEDIFEYRKKVINHSVNNRQLCSGYCCGNPRRWFKEVTFQEKRFNLICE